MSHFGWVGGGGVIDVSLYSFIITILRVNWVYAKMAVNGCLGDNVEQISSIISFDLMGIVRGATEI